MSKQQIITHRIIAVLLIVLGLVLGVTWTKTGFCIGDNIFTALGLPAWSKGTSGTHYPAIIGSIGILIGIGALNCTLQKKTCKWLWLSVIIFLIALQLFIVHI